MNPTRYPCPCCGYRTYAEPAGGTMVVCPVCGWEDAPGETSYNGSNEVSLVQGQRNFLLTGACETHLGDVVRAPLPEEARSAHWLSFDGLCKKIIKAIERDFQDVTRDGGTTLHQMDWVDACSLPTSKAMRAAEAKDPEIRWQDIPGGKLSSFSQSMVFLDPLGYRFYLPAFMRHALITSCPEIGNAEIDGVLWSLDGGPCDHYRGESLALLTPAQMRSVAAFVYLFAMLGDEYQAPYACKGLKHGWDDFVPEYLPLCFQ